MHWFDTNSKMFGRFIFLGHWGQRLNFEILTSKFFSRTLLVILGIAHEPYKHFQSSHLFPFPLQRDQNLRISKCNLQRFLENLKLYYLEVWYIVYLDSAYLVPRLIHCVSHSLDTMQKVKKNLKEHCYTANPVPVMKTVIPCAHILTGKTCFNHKKNLLLLQGSCSHCREPVFKTGGSLHAPCSTLYEIALYFPATQFFRLSYRIFFSVKILNFFFPKILKKFFEKKILNGGYPWGWLRGSRGSILEW